MYYATDNMHIFNQIIVEIYAALFICTAMVQASAIMTASTSQFRFKQLVEARLLSLAGPAVAQQVDSFSSGLQCWYIQPCTLSIASS